MKAEIHMHLSTSRPLLLKSRLSCNHHRVEHHPPTASTPCAHRATFLQQWTQNI